MDSLIIKVKQSRQQVADTVIVGSGSELRNLYRVYTWIDEVIVSPDGGTTLHPSPNIPLEMFLYRKQNNTDNAIEKLVSSSFVRVCEPSDFDTDDPVVWGTEARKWVRDPWNYGGIPGSFDGSLILVPSMNTADTELQFAQYLEAMAPKRTRCSSGNFVSRLHISQNQSIAQAYAAAQDILTTIRVFAIKYNTILANTLPIIEHTWVEHEL